MKIFLFIFLFFVGFLFIFIDKKDVQYLGCSWARDSLKPQLCSMKNIKMLGCSWQVPSYMIEKTGNPHMFYFESDFGFHKIYFDEKEKNGPTSDITSMLEKNEDKEFIKKTYVTKKTFPIYGAKEVHITRKNHEGQVRFLQIDEQPYFLKCLASAKGKKGSTKGTLPFN